jgi:hypothetical protein
MPAPTPGYFAIVALSLALTACSSSNNGAEVTGKGSIQGLHAMPEVGTVSFLIEETLLTTLDYKDASGISQYDDIEYTFRYEILLPGDDEATELTSTTLTVDSEQEYLFVLTGTLDAPELILWEQFGRDWDQELDDAEEDETTVTVAEISFGHLWNTSENFDIYVETPGTSPLATTPKATIEYSNRTSAVEIEAGEYQIVITPPGDPSTIVFASDPIDIPAATSNLLVLMDDGGTSTAAFTVRWIGSSLGAELYDRNLQSELTVVHAALGTDSIDALSGGTTPTVLATDLAYKGTSESSSVDTGELSLNVTPSGNPGVFLAEDAFNIAEGSFNRVYLIGIPGMTQVVLTREDRRRLATHARIQTFQAAARFAFVDIYLVATDIDISLINPTFTSLVYGTSTGLINFEPGDYNLVVTEPGTKNIIAGPITVSLAANDIRHVTILDSPSVTAAEIQFLD